MPEYRRVRREGGTYFLTLVMENRVRVFGDMRARGLLHEAISQCGRKRPFEIEAMVLLPDHLHLMMTLPDGDDGFSERIAGIKARFTTAWLERGGSEQPRSGSKVRHRNRGVWQRRFWEHVIRDDEDYARHLDYIHYNPVKHGVAVCPHGWEYSTFGRHVEKKVYEVDWQCACRGEMKKPPEFGWAEGLMME